MDEINKIPPVTRYLLIGTLGATIPAVLKLYDPSPLVLYWPYVLHRWQFWRPVTSFFLAGSGIQLIFDIIAIFRSSSALEEGEPFYRSTSTYTWTLILTNALILLLNYPLNSAVLFRPLLYAITTFWSRAYRSASVNIFGIVNVRAPLLPYAYIALDVLMAGPHAGIQSGTGILAAYAIHYIRDEIPRPPPGSRLAAQGSIFQRLIAAVQHFVCVPPAALQRLLPDSIDPVAGGARPYAGSTSTTAEGRAVRSMAFGTAFAPRGRAFGSAPAASAGSGGPSAPRGGASLSSSSQTAGGGWLGGLFGSGSGGSSGSASGTPSSESARRQAMLDAIERRNRAARNDSIAGRAQAAASASAGSANLQGDSKTSALASSSSSGAAALRRTAASASSAQAPSSGAGASGNIHTFAFGSAAASAKKDADEPELDSSGSGGRVAEQRRSKDPGDAEGSGATKKSSSSSDSPPSWGGGGSGRRLDE